MNESIPIQKLCLSQNKVKNVYSKYACCYLIISTIKVLCWQWSIVKLFQKIVSVSKELFIIFKTLQSAYLVISIMDKWVVKLQNNMQFERGDYLVLRIPCLSIL